MDALERRALPEGWEWKRLGDVAQFFYGYPFDSSKFNNEGCGTPLIRIRNLIDGKTETYYDGEFDESYIIKNGDILIGMDGEFNIVKWTGQMALLNQRVCKLNITSEELKPAYAYRVLVKILKRIEDKTPFVTVKHLSAKHLNSIQIPLPPLPTQRRIVSILEKAEETKRLRAQADELTDRLLKSVFMEMFGDPVRNPNGWDVKKIEDIIISIEAGWSVNGEQRPLKEDELGVLKVSAVTKGVFLSSENKAISKSQILKKVINPEKGDLLFSRANTRELVGATCLIDKNYPNLLLPDKLWKIKPDKKQLISEYFKFILSNPAIRKIISSNATGTSGSMYNISMNKLKSISIPIPPLPLQQKFARIIEKIEYMRQSQKQSKQHIEDLFSALMQKAFRGEI